MSLKQLIILVLILFFVPGILGKVSLAPLGDFFNHMSIDSFKNVVTTIAKDDIVFYRNLVMPWFQKIVDLVKKNTPPTNPQ